MILAYIAFGLIVTLFLLAVFARAHAEVYMNLYRNLLGGLNV